MDLSSPDFSDLFTPKPNPDPHHSLLEDPIFPSYDFHPSRAVGSPTTTPPYSSRPSSSGDPMNFTRVQHESSKKPLSQRTKDTHDVDMVVEIDRIVKKHADNIFDAIEDVSARLSQLESRTRLIENSVDNLKLTIGDGVGSSNGKLRQLENILREVQTGVQVLRDRNEIYETRKQQAMFETSTIDHKHANATPDYQQQAPVPPPQTYEPPPNQPPFQVPPQPTVPQLPQFVPPTALPHQPPTPSQPSPATTQFPHTPSHSQIPPPQSFPHQHSFQPPPVPPQETPNQQYQQAPIQQPPAPPQQHYQVPPHMRYSQPPHTVSVQPPLRKPEEIPPYTLHHQSYPPMGHQPGEAPPTHFYGSHGSNLHEPPSSRPGPGQAPYAGDYGAPPGPNLSEQYDYGGSPSHYSSSMRPSPFASSSSPRGESYPRLPTAQVLPQAMPIQGSEGTTVRLDEVVDKVVAMGFPRDQVRATIGKLTENGQAVDLNVVLDKMG